MAHGTIVFLNGTSSSGKTTLPFRASARRRAVTGGWGRPKRRSPGLARFRQLVAYGLQVDTGLRSPSECAQQVMRLANDSALKTAFEKMRETCRSSLNSTA